MSMPILNELIHDPEMHTTLALYLLASILKQRGHSVKVPYPFTIAKILPQKVHKDLPIAENLSTVFKKEISDMDAICISSNSTTWPANKHLNKHLIEEIKKLDIDKKIILGGIHPSYFYLHIKKQGFYDTHPNLGKDDLLLIAKQFRYYRSQGIVL